MDCEVLTEIEGRVAVLTLNRPKNLNALDDAILLQLETSLRSIAKNESVLVVVISGSGMRAFSAGSDLKEATRQTKAEQAAHCDLGQRVIEYITEFTCPVIAAIEGYCLGGGLELALACDMRIAASNAKLGLPEVVNLNALPAWGGTYRLAPLVGPSRAREMLLFGKQLTGDEAYAWCLVNQVVAPGKSLERAKEIAHSLPATTERSVLGIAKRLMTQGSDVSAHSARFFEYLAENLVASSGTGFQNALKQFQK